MRIFLSIFAVLIIGFGAAAYFIADIAEAEIHALLNEKGVPYHSIEVGGVSPTSITLENIVLGQDKEVTADSITIAYRGGTDLDSLRVNVDVENLGVVAQQHAKGWSIGGVEALWQPAGAALGPALATIQLQNTAMDITGNKAPEFSGEVMIGSLSFQQPKALVADVKNAKLTPALAGKQFTLGYDIASLTTVMKDGASPKQITAPLAIKGMAKHMLGADELAHNSTITALKKAFSLAVKGTHRIAAGSGNAKVSLPDTDFAPNGLTFAALSPGYAAGVDTPDMRIAADVKAQYGRSAAPTLNGVLDIPRMPMIDIMAKSLGRGATMEGTLKANVPFTFRSAKNWRVENATIVNEGPVSLTLLPVKKEAARAISAIVAAVTKKPELAQVGEPNKINVRTLDLVLQSTNNQGGLRVSGAVAGDNPMFRNDVSMQVNFTTNLVDMLRSMGSAALKKLQ